MTLSHSELLQCSACFKLKFGEDFYKSNKSKCKDCIKAAMKVRRLTNPYVQEYDRLRYKNPERRAKGAENASRWRREHSDAYRAQTAVNNALRDRRLEKGPCAICGGEQ